MMDFSLDELEVIAEALDSHRYWQLSERNYRRDGCVMPPGSEDPDAVTQLAFSERLEDKVRNYLSEVDK